MSASSPKKQCERRYLARFCSACSEVPGGEPIADENPDFLIPSQTGYLGLEITEYYAPPRPGSRPLQEQESLRWQIAGRAKQLFQNAGGPALYVGVHFRTYDALDRRDIDHHASTLANLVASSLLREGETCRLPDDPFHFLPSPFHAINIGCFDVLTDGFWSVPDAAFIPHLQSSEIQVILDSKARRVETYRQRTPAVWLLIVAQGTRISSMAFVPDSVRAHAYKFAFDRAFYLDYFDGIYWEIKRE